MLLQFHRKYRQVAAFGFGVSGEHDRAPRGLCLEDVVVAHLTGHEDSAPLCDRIVQKGSSGAGTEADDLVLSGSLVRSSDSDFRDLGTGLDAVGDSLEASCTVQNDLSSRS